MAMSKEQFNEVKDKKHSRTVLENNPDKAFYETELAEMCNYTDTGIRHQIDKMYKKGLVRKKKVVEEGEKGWKVYVNWCVFDILDNSLEDIKEELSKVSDPDYKTFLEYEKDFRDRKTVKRWLQGKM